MSGKLAGVCMCVCVCVCARTRTCMYVCMCECPFTVKASSVRISWNAREHINNVLKTFLSSAKSLHRCFRMKHQAFLTTEATLSCLHTRSGQSHDSASVHLASENIHLPSFIIIRHRPCLALHIKPIGLWRLHLREGSQSN